MNSLRHIKKHFIYFLMASITMLNLNACTESKLQDKALQELLHTLETQEEFIKVHAAEYLIWLGHTAEARKEFLKENELHGNQPKYRIGIWRVLAQTETDAQQKKNWTDKIAAAFADLNGPDRLHAAETLAKLKISPRDESPEATQKSLADESRNMQVYTQWAVSYSPGADVRQSTQHFLDLLVNDTNDVVRLISGYILRKTKGLTPEQWSFLVARTLIEPDTSKLKKPLLNTAFVTLPDNMDKPTEYQQIKQLLIQHPERFTAGERIDVSQSLAEKGDESDIELLTSFLENKNIEGIYEANTREAADVRAAAAYAILSIKNK